MTGYGLTEAAVLKAQADTEALRKELADLGLNVSVTSLVAWSIGLEQLTEHLGAVFG